MSRIRQPIGAENHRGALCSTAFVLLCILIPMAASAAVISFPDPWLETAIREAIGKPSGGIYDYQLEDLPRQ